MKVSKVGLILILFCTADLVGEDWPQWRGPQRDGVWRETGTIRRNGQEPGALMIQQQQGTGCRIRLQNSSPQYPSILSVYDPHGFAAA